MKRRSAVYIGDKTYPINPAVDRYQVPLAELGQLRMRDVPGHAHLEVQGIHVPFDPVSVEHYALNSGDDGSTEFLEVYGGATWSIPTANRPRMLARLRRAFPDLDPMGDSLIRNPHISTRLRPEDNALVDVFMNLKFGHTPDMLVRDALIPFINGYDRLLQPSVHAFICHASEDKTVAREIATAMKALGADIWFDEWEIRVGDSIVERISTALGEVSHLLILLSRHSAAKPWVQKELSSALMRQLSSQSIVVLPVRLDNSDVPPILSDVKYADARAGIAAAVAELSLSVFARADADEEA